MSSLSSAAGAPPATRPPIRLSQLGDELLARYAARGSERAFAALYERYHQQLYRYCRSIVRDDADAQDALQSTFVGALQALQRNQRNAPLRPWLYRIAHNEAISLLRRRNRDSGEELRADHVGVRWSVEQEAAERARWRALVADVGSLPDRQRGALLLRELSGLSHEEIGIALGTSTAGAKQAIFEARQALAEIEEGRTMSCEDVRRRISEGDRRVLRGRRVGAHLRECAACEAFALAIPARSAQLRALTPVLAPAAATALLARSLHAASFNGASATGTSAAAASSAAGKAAGSALAWKALAGAAVIATTAAGVTGLRHVLHHGTSRPAAAVAVPVPHSSPAPAAGAAHATRAILTAHAADAYLRRPGSATPVPALDTAHAAAGARAAQVHPHLGRAKTHSRGHSGPGVVHTSRGLGHGHSSASSHGSGSGGHSFTAASPGHASSAPARSSASSSPAHSSTAQRPVSVAVPRLPRRIKRLTLRRAVRRSAVRIHTPSR